MCLYTEKKDKIIQTAKEDIVCYKALRRVPIKGVVHYRTPVMGYDVDPDVVEKQGTLEAKGRASIRKNASENYTSVNGGFIHTYAEPNIDIDFLCFSNILYKCIIPKGTKYVVGTTEINGHWIPCYASKKIIFVEPYPYRNYRNIGYCSDIFDSMIGALYKIKD